MTRTLLISLLSLAAVVVCGDAAAFSESVLIDAEVVQPKGFTLRHTGTMRTADGLRFGGTLCRRPRTFAQTPLRIRVEKHAADGSITASSHRILSRLRTGHVACDFFQVRFDWSVSPGDRIRMCAVSTSTGCSSPSSPGSQASMTAEGPPR